MIKEDKKIEEISRIITDNFVHLHANNFDT